MSSENRKKFGLRFFNTLVMVLFAALVFVGILLFAYRSYKQKTMLWFEKSAHFPHWEEPHKFADAMLRILSEINLN